MPFAIEIRHGSETRDFPLPEDRPTTIGRAADNDITLEDPLVSRRHARIEPRAGDWYLLDLGSANGTIVDGGDINPREPCRVTNGQAIGIGSFTLTLRVVEPASQPVSGQPAGAEPGSDAYTFIVKPEPRLLITTPDWTREVPLAGDRVFLGRTPVNDIVVDAAVVSRQHAELTRTGESWTMVDLNSTNGLSYEGDRISSRRLEDGDVLWIADSVSITYRSLPFGEIAEEEQRAERLELRGQREITIGRHPRADVTVSHPTVSRMHARLSLRDGHYAVEDLASSNGTYVNGDAVAPGEPRVLQPGDSIRIGPVRFEFSAEALQQIDESTNLRLDALHLNQPVARGVNLLKDISLSVNPREFVAVVGVSGAGKSTLLDALNGFRPAGRGAVLVNGTDLYRNFDAYRNDVGYVPQDDIIHKELPVQAALDYSAQLRLPSDTTAVERRQRVTEVMGTLGLTERAQVAISRLSGGQRKRVSIGAELLTKPGLFYLDEATSGLDPGTESQLMRLLRRLADDGHTILLITHATKNVMLCDQVIFLARGGHLAFFGPPDEALNHFGTDDFDGIYEKLEEELSPEEWDARYKQSDAYRRCVAGRLNAQYGPGAAAAGAEAGSPASVQAAAPKRPEKAPSKVSMLRQFWILSARYLNIMRRDRTNLALMFAISPLLGAIDLLAWERNVLDPVEGDATTSMTMLFMAALIPFLVGALTSVREIVKESPIYRRERTVTLKIAPYLLSKVWIGFLFALYHATALFGMKLLAVDFQDASTADLAQFWFTVALASMSGVLWGLFISAIVPREEQAMVLVIAVVVIQMVFSGGLLPLSDLGAAGDVLGSITSTKWVFQGLASAAHVMQGECPPLPASLETCQLPGLGFYETEAERRVVVDPILEKFGGVFGEDVYKTWIALGIIMVALFAVIIGLQKRKDVV
jgi:ABC-type multidrug transport system ATPase subunit/pSer/pThr/pTyr-binding forkhead associated (FHA) protein